MASCVHEVLQGNVSVAEVKAWLAQPCPVPPAPFSGGPDSPCSPSRLGSLINVTPEQFRVLVLNHVKEEAEAIFAAAEQQAAAAQHQATSAQHPKPICTSHQKPTAPGAVSDMAFPALPVHSDKVFAYGFLTCLSCPSACQLQASLTRSFADALQKKALDRRLSTRQLDLQSAPDLAPAKRSSHKKKIAPTKMQPGSSSSQTFPSGIIYTAEVPASDSLSLIQEASARDLWNPAPHHVDKPNLEEQDRQHQVELQPTSSAQASTDEDSCFVTPYKLRSAWGEKSTPPSAGSTNSPTISKHPSPQTNAWAERTRQSPSASLLSRHSAPAAMTPASKAGTAAKTGKAVRNRRISPVQVRPEERSFSAVLAVGTAAGQPAFAKAAPAWSGNKLQLVNGGTSGCTLSGIHPALENRLASPSTPQSCNPCDSSTDPNPFFAALPNSRGNSNDSPSGHPISNQGWSTPPLAQRSRSGKAQRGSSLGSVGWQNSSPASSQAQANTQHSSPGSTATSKPTWLHVGAQGTHMPMTPTSQADSTDTCYATPGSTIRVMQDIAQEDSPAAASPAGSALLTPGSATTSSQCAAAMSNPQGTLAGTPAALQAALPADIAAARMSQVNAEPLAEARAGSLLREEGAHNVANACLPGIDPVMTQQAGRLAELHAFILAGEVCCCVCHHTVFYVFMYKLPFILLEKGTLAEYIEQHCICFAINRACCNQPSRYKLISDNFKTLAAIPFLQLHCHQHCIKTNCRCQLCFAIHSGFNVNHEGSCSLLKQCLQSL